MEVCNLLGENMRIFVKPLTMPKLIDLNRKNFSAKEVCIGKVSVHDRFVVISWSEPNDIHVNYVLGPKVSEDVEHNLILLIRVSCQHDEIKALVLEVIWRHQPKEVEERLN